MSQQAVHRSFVIIRHLKRHQRARFHELYRELRPISKTTLSHLLAALIEEGELIHDSPYYALRTSAVSMAGHHQGFYRLPPELASPLEAHVKAAALALGHSCALFGWVGTSTMKILATHNLDNWNFSPVGYEWPLVPFHGFAQLFLAYAPESLAFDCFHRWQPFLKGHRDFVEYREFRARLRAIRCGGHVVEFRQEDSTQLRIAAPIQLGAARPCYALGLRAHAVHLLNAENHIALLKQHAKKLGQLMSAFAPAFTLDPVHPIAEDLPAGEDTLSFRQPKALPRTRSHATSKLGHP